MQFASLLRLGLMVIALMFIALLFTGAQAGTVLEQQTFETGDADPLRYTVYLPDAYDTDTRSYPVVYLLHGYGGTDTDWVRYGDAAYIADKLIERNAIPPMILIMPDAANSWYVNSPDYGRFEDALLGLIDYVDATYRTVPERDSRAIGGLSMGGYGAARFAIKYPELFAAASVMSGAIFPTVPPDATELLGEVFGDPIDTARYQRDLPQTLLQRWTPDTEKPDFYVTVGDDDPLTPYPLSANLREALVSAGAEVQFRVTDGTHAWPVWKAALDDTLLFFVSAFEGYY